MPVIYPDFEPVERARSACRSREAREIGESRPSLGIVVCERALSPPFAEAAFVRRLVEAGPGQGLDVFAFSPAGWSEETGTVRAWIWRSGWRRVTRPAPAVAYDRSWSPADAALKLRHRRALARMKEGGLLLLNARLPGKAEVFRALLRSPAVRRWLPPTSPYRGGRSLASWLDRRQGSAFLKPSSGSQGRRVIAVSREDAEGRVCVRGRDGRNRPFRLGGLDESEALSRIDRWVGLRPYIMQPLLELTGADGEPFDVRVLMQRGGDGAWTSAGMAARCGRSGAVTANLHGGGTARRAESYLTERFGNVKASALLGELREAASAVIERLELSYGRFAELGLDFGIDRSGKLWFLEANAKPGRASMACAGGAAAKEAAERPLAYARYILLRSPGRVIHEFDSM